MTKRTMSVDELYSEGRHYPRGQTRDPGAKNSIERSPSFEPAARGTAFNRVFNENTVQDPEDRHDEKARYSNDASGWTRGARGQPTGNNEDGTGYPGGFDRSNAWRSPSKSIHGPDAGDQTNFVKPERIAPASRQKRDEM
jgi:hypothetical protein